MAGGGRCWRLEVPDQEHSHLTVESMLGSLGEWHAHGIAFEIAGVQSHRTTGGVDPESRRGPRTAPGRLISEAARLGRR